MIVTAFEQYRPEGFSAGLAERNLREKLATESFRRDLDPLLAVDASNTYNIDIAGELVICEILRRIN